MINLRKYKPLLNYSIVRIRRVHFDVIQYSHCAYYDSDHDYMPQAPTFVYSLN